MNSQFKRELIKLIEDHHIDATATLPAEALADHLVREIRSLTELINERRDYYRAEQMRVFSRSALFKNEG